MHLISTLFIVSAWTFIVSCVIAFIFGIALIIFAQKDLDLSKPILTEMVYKSMFAAYVIAFISAFTIIAICVITVFMAV